MLGKLGADIQDVVGGLRSAVQFLLQVGYLEGKVLEHLLHVGYFVVLPGLAVACVGSFE